MGGQTSSAVMRSRSVRADASVLHPDGKTHPDECSTSALAVGCNTLTPCKHPGYCCGGEECCCPQLSRIPGGEKKRGDNRRSVHTSNDVNVDSDPQSVHQICPFTSANRTTASSLRLAKYWAIPWSSVLMLMGLTKNSSAPACFDWLLSLGESWPVTVDR